MAKASIWDTIIGFVAINPLHVSISVPEEAKLGRNFKAEVTVENRGDERISNVVVEIFISNGLVLVNKNTVKESGTIKGNGTRNILWQVKGTEAGNFSVSVRASAVVREDAVSIQGNTAIITITDASVTPVSTPNMFQIFLNFFRRWFL